MKLLHLRWLSNEHWLQIFFLLNLSRYSKMHLRHEFPITILLFNIAPIGMCSFCLFFKLLQKKRKNKSCFGYMQGRLHRCVTYAVVTQGPTLRKAPCLFECSAVTILKFIIILSLKLCFVNEIQRDNGALHDRYMCIRCFLTPHLRIVFLMLHKHRIPGDSVWGLGGTQSKYKISISWKPLASVKCW